MKTLYLRALAFGLLFSTVLISKAQAQYMVNGKEVDTTFNHSMNQIFGKLNTANIPFGLLRDYAMEFVNLENYNGAALVDSNYVNSEAWLQIYSTLATARMTTGSYTTLPSPSVVDSLWAIARTPGHVTLSGLFYQYAYLASNADSTGKITVSNNQLLDKYVNGVWQNPYLQASVMAFAPSTDTYQGQSVNIYLPANLWLTNSASLVKSIQIDMGDGTGYQTLTPGTALQANYCDTGMMTLNFKVTLTNNTVLQSHSQLHIVEDPLSLYPVAPPGNLNTNGFTASQNPNVYNVTSTQAYNGIYGQGMVTVQYSGKNGTNLVNPLIVVEGFDPGVYLTPENPAGWYTLTDFNASVRDGKSPALTNLLQGNVLQGISATYDIVFIDFKNGIDDIHRNGLIVEDVIRWVNAHKTGSNKNVVLGLSMGGLCARYALDEMETAGQNHQVRLFISHGTPHQGAVVPLGFQYLEHHINNLYFKAGLVAASYDFIRLFQHPSWPDVDNILALSDAPAAEQMLVNRIDDNYQLDNTIHTNWQNELTSLKYPVQGGIRNVAISNGSECGQTQTLSQNGQLFYLHGKFNPSLMSDLMAEVMGGFGLYALWSGQPSLLLTIVPGRNSLILNFQVNAAQDGGGNLAYTGTMTYQKVILWLIPINITMSSRTFNTPSGVYPLETFGGDFYNLQGLSFNSSENIVLLQYSISLNLAPAFGFVPTPSVLDIGKGSVTLPESDYTLPYSQLTAPPYPTPFVNFITSYSPLNSNNNEQHITYDTRNGNWLANELNAQPQTADCSAFCQISSISGDQYDCNSIKSYTVQAYNNVVYTWSVTNNLTISSGQGTASLQVHPTSGAGPGTATITLKMTINGESDCGTSTITRTVNLGIEPLVVNATVDRTPQPSGYQYLTATATQLDGTVPSNYNWYLMVNNQPTTLIGTGLTLSHYPIAPCSAIYYECQATTVCGPSIYSSYAYNTNCGGNYAMTSQSVVIYPNPADQTMSVTNNNIPATTDASGNATGIVAQTYQLVVLDNLGNTLLTQQNQNGSPTITFGTANIANGHYFIHVIQGSTVIEKQIVIQHN